MRIDLTCAFANPLAGLSVHMNQVHKEVLTSVDNSLPNRQGLEVEVFGTEGIPEDVRQAHDQRIIAAYYQAEAERRAATGNPAPGTATQGGQPKKPKFESPAELKKRLAEHKARKAEQAANGGSGGNTPLEGMVQSPMGQSPGPYVSLMIASGNLVADGSFVEWLPLRRSTDNLRSPSSRGLWCFPTRAYRTARSCPLPATVQPSIFRSSWPPVPTISSRPTRAATATLPPVRLPTSTKLRRCSVRRWIPSRFL
jgi:hypothetical protein